MIFYFQHVCSNAHESSFSMTTNASVPNWNDSIVLNIELRVLLNPTQDRYRVKTQLKPMVLSMISPQILNSFQTLINFNINP